NGAAKSEGISAAAKLRVDVNGVQTDILPIQDAKSGGDDLSVLPDGSGDGVHGNSAVHGRDDLAVHGVGGSFQLKQPFDPAAGNGLFQQKPIRARRTAVKPLQIHYHYLGSTFYGIVSALQFPVEDPVHHLADLKYGRRAPFAVNLLAVFDLVVDGDGGESDLLHAVGSVGRKIGHTQQPSVIDLYLMRGPGIQRKIFYSFDY